MKDLLEGRAFPQLPLRWPVRLLREEGGSVEALTESLSGSGFYLHTDQPFSPGERLVCQLRMPPEEPGQAHEISLHCVVKVVRIDVWQDGFGLSCHIEEYSFDREHMLNRMRAMPRD